MLESQLWVLVIVEKSLSTAELRVRPPSSGFLKYSILTPICTGLHINSLGGISWLSPGWAPLRDPGEPALVQLALEDRREGTGHLTGHPEESPGDSTIVFVLRNSFPGIQAEADSRGTKVGETQGPSLSGFGSLHC